VTNIFRNGAIAGALLATAAFVTTPALAIEGDVDVNANTGGADVRVDTNRPALEADTPKAEADADAKADAKIYAEEESDKGAYAGDDDDGPTNDRDDSVDIGEPGATVDID
jgi:hypothetical protein